MSKKLDELEKLDAIEKAEGPKSLVSPVVIALKKNDEIRFCVDMRQANVLYQRTSPHTNSGRSVTRA